MTIQQTKIAWDTKTIPSGRNKPPVYYDKDYHCSICGEPWDSYGLKHRLDFSSEQVEQFHKGLGCLACDFSRKSNYLFTLDNTRLLIRSPDQ